MEKAREKNLWESLIDTTQPAEVTRVSSLLDLVLRYQSAMSNMDMDVAMELKLSGIKKF